MQRTAASMSITGTRFMVSNIHAGMEEKQKLNLQVLGISQEMFDLSKEKQKRKLHLCSEKNVKNVRNMNKHMLTVLLYSHQFLELNTKSYFSRTLYLSLFLVV